MSVARSGHTATLLPDGRVLIAGGDGYAAQRSAELYDPATGAFSPTGSMIAGRSHFTATLLRDGRVLVAGGTASGVEKRLVLNASAELYDPKTGTFSATGSMAQPRDGHSATLLPDGRVLVVGGARQLPSGGIPPAELYDPKTGTFSPTGSMNLQEGASDFGGHTATLLPDGRILVANGGAEVKLYDPKTGTFSPAGPMTGNRGLHIATLLSDGRVLIAGGGFDGVNQGNNSAELYDPKTGTFSPTGSMATTCNCIAHFEAVTAPLLADGRVLVPDISLDASGVPIGTAELYNPGTGTFSRIGPMIESRTGFASTLLADGRVLFVGGVCPIVLSGYPSRSPKDDAAAQADGASAELYVP